MHYIDFGSFKYKEGYEFDLLIYAVQNDNSKLEILYDIICGVVGEIKGITEIKEIIDANYVNKLLNKIKQIIIYFMILKDLLLACHKLKNYK